MDQSTLTLGKLIRCKQVSDSQCDCVGREKSFQMVGVHYVWQNAGMVHAGRQRSCRRTKVKARSGIATVGWLLVPIFAAAITTVSCEDNSTKDSVVSECRRLYESQSLSELPVTFSKDDHVEMKSESRGGWRLLSFLRLHDFHIVEELNTGYWTVLCVGLQDSTSFSTKGNGRDPDAWFAIETVKDVPVGFVRVITYLWRNYNNFKDCQPAFMPLPYFANLSQYNHSPLEEDFWSKMSVETGLKENWIRRITAKTNKGSIPAEWIYKMNIPSLRRLEMFGNDWKRPKNLFKPMPHLWRLRLSSNKLESIPDGMLLGMPSLTEIILGQNNISEYPRDIRHLPNLGRLDLTNPIGDAILRIEDEDIKSFPKTLYNFGAENSNLEANVSNMLVLPNLTFLNLSGCGLGHINDHELIKDKSGLVTIDLSNNGLKYVPPNIFKEMPDLRELFLNRNELEEWPKEILTRNSLILLVLSHNRISNLTIESFEHFKMLQILIIPWNEIHYLPENTFQDLHDLKTLDLSYNKLTNIPDMLFKNNRRLVQILLEGNKLKNGPNLWQLHLDTLDLSHNDLKYFACSNTSSIKKLDIAYNNVSNVDISSTIEKMDMSYNSLSFISPNLWAELIQLKEVDLGGNDFECCLFGKRTYLNESHTTEILNLGSKDPLICSINQTSPKLQLQSFVYNETECNAEIPTPFRIAVVLPLALLVMIGTVMMVMMYVYRFELTYVKHLFKMRKNGGETDEERYKTCSYDAFVCYSAKNFEWVIHTLLPGIEGGPEGYRLCVHDRDFAVGAGINRNIVASLEKSRKVIFLLSADFIASKWCHWELEMANHKLFEEKRNYIILVELERLPRRSLPRHLRYLMDRTTYLEWPEGEAGAAPPEQKQRECLRRLQKAMGASLRQRTGRDNEGFCTVLDK